MAKPGLHYKSTQSNSSELIQRLMFVACAIIILEWDLSYHFLELMPRFLLKFLVNKRAPS